MELRNIREKKNPIMEKDDMQKLRYIRLLVDGQQQVEIDNHEETINQLLNITFGQNNLQEQEKRSMESIHEINQEIDDIS